MKVHTLVATLSIDGVHEMDTHINDWMERNKVTPSHITQTYAMETGHDGRRPESVIVTSIWY